MVTMVMTKLVQQTSLSVTIQHQQIIAHVEIERHVETTKRRTNPECHMTADKESRRVGGGGVVEGKTDYNATSPTDKFSVVWSPLFWFSVPVPWGTLMDYVTD